MNSFFIEFRDPLFGIIVFFVLVFLIAISSYWWAKYKNKEHTKSLGNFLNDFKKIPSSKDMQQLIAKGEMSERSWILLASLYSKNGDYEKSIEIYSELLKITDKSNVIEIMYLLGRTYFKAGFLERSKKIFLTILKDNPRSPKVLHNLLLVYEYMKDYDSALEVLEPLDELKTDIELDAQYLKATKIIHSSKMGIDEKSQKLLDIYNKNGNLTYMIFEYLFKHNTAFAWQNLDASKSELLTDIFWNLNPKDLDFDIISKNGYLRELYSARGDIKDVSKSSVFEFDVLINLDKKASATLSFEYICDNCKHLFPFPFNRCANCHSVDTSNIEISLIKDFNREYCEENNSFQ
jgi:tetratricopeptide (TPR) repeat protein